VLAKQLRLDVAQLTDVGRKREHNEDNMAYVIPKDAQVMTKKGALFIVADGMGGHAAGEVASEIAVDTVSNVYYQDDSDDVAASLIHAIKRANASIHQRAAENMLRSGMGTTCVACVLRGNMAYVANVGDSRAYLARGSSVKQISQDHSWVAEQVRAGLLTEDQARTHGQRNVITRCLGTQADVDIDVFYEQLQEGDSLVLCTDGLSGLVSDEEILRIVNQYVPQESVYHLVERANENGGPDNITAIVVRVQEVGVEPPNARHPVGVGSGREIGEESTLLLEKLPNASPMLPVGAVAETARISSGPLWSPADTLSSPENTTAAPQAVVSKPEGRRSRLFYPTLAILTLLILAVIGGGIYYFLPARTGTNVEQSLHNAENLLMQARGEISAQPAAALQHLAQAQNILRSLQKASPTASQGSTINNLLQKDLTTEVKAALTSYNQLALISLLPCQTTPVTAINEGNTTRTIALTQATDTRGAVVTYVQGQDNHLYLLDTQNHLTNQQALPDGGQVLAMAGDGPRLFVLSQVTKANTPPAFDLIQLTPGQLKAKGQTTIKLSGDLVPKFLTAWGSDVYVVLVSSSASTTVQILDYTADKLTDAPRSRSITASNSVVSVAAFPGYLLFLLLADGSVQSLQFLDQTQPPAAVLVPSAIASPLAVTASEFTPAKDVPKVASVTQTRNTPLVLPGTPGTVMLAAGSINAGATVPHLYIVDTPNHRILDLAQMSSTAKSTEVQTPTPPITGSPPASSTGVGGTAVSSPAGNTVTLSLVTQYVSNSLFAQARSLSVDPKGTGVAVLIDQFPSTRSLVTIPTGMKTVCSSS
jgi:serine/threonine protein phosphatase PrpC